MEIGYSFLSGIISFLCCLLPRTSLLVLLISQLGQGNWRLDRLWSKVLSWPTPAFLTVQLPWDAGTVHACHSDASQPPGQLTLLQPRILSLFFWLTYTAHPLKTTETLRGYPMPHWGHRNPLLPSKSCCHSYCAAPAPWWFMAGLPESCATSTEVQEGQQSFCRLSALLSPKGFYHQPLTHWGGPVQGHFRWQPPKILLHPSLPPQPGSFLSPARKLCVGSEEGS